MNGHEDLERNPTNWPNLNRKELRTYFENKFVCRCTCNLSQSRLQKTRCNVCPVWSRTGQKWSVFIPTAIRTDLLGCRSKRLLCHLLLKTTVTSYNFLNEPSDLVRRNDTNNEFRRYERRNLLNRYHRWFRYVRWLL